MERRFRQHAEDKWAAKGTLFADLPITLKRQAIIVTLASP
jgi:hypothetical protein